MPQKTPSTPLTVGGAYVGVQGNFNKPGAKGSKSGSKAVDRSRTPQASNRRRGLFSRITKGEKNDRPQDDTEVVQEPKAGTNY